MHLESFSSANNHLQRKGSAGDIGSVNKSVDIEVVNPLEEIIVLGETGDGVELTHVDLFVVDIKEVDGTVLAYSIEFYLQAAGIGELAGRSVEGGSSLDELAPTAEEFALVCITAGNALDKLDAAGVLPIFESLDRLALPSSPEPNGVVNRRLGVVKDELATRVGQINEVTSRGRFIRLDGGGGSLRGLRRPLRIDWRDGTWTTACGSPEILKIIRRSRNW